MRKGSGWVLLCHIYNFSRKGPSPSTFTKNGEPCFFKTCATPHPPPNQPHLTKWFKDRNSEPRVLLSHSLWPSTSLPQDCTSFAITLNILLILWSSCDIGTTRLQSSCPKVALAANDFHPALKPFCHRISSVCTWLQFVGWFLSHLGLFTFRH